MNFTNSTTNTWWAKYYEVDITKPPHFPPARQTKTHWWYGEIETEESKTVSEAWSLYANAYGQALFLKALSDRVKTQ